MEHWLVTRTDAAGMQERGKCRWLMTRCSYTVTQMLHDRAASLTDHSTSNIIKSYEQPWFYTNKQLCFRSPSRYCSGRVSNLQLDGHGLILICFSHSHCKKAWASCQPTTCSYLSGMSRRSPSVGYGLKAYSLSSGLWQQHYSTQKNCSLAVSIS